MKLVHLRDVTPIKDISRELISQPLTMEFSIQHFWKEGSVEARRVNSPLMYPNLSLPAIYIATNWCSRIIRNVLGN